MRDDPDLLDPTLSRTYVGTLVMTAICDKLFDFDAKQQIVPVLATGYEWVDPTTLLIRLRPGVSFQDGEPLDAAAVKYTLERHAGTAGQLPAQRDRRHGAGRGGGPADGAGDPEAAVLAVHRRADRPRRHGGVAEGRRGGRQGFRPAAGLRRTLQVSRNAWPRTASCSSASRSYWDAGAHPLRPRHLSRRAGQQHPAREPQGRRARHRRGGAARRRQRPRPTRSSASSACPASAMAR